MPHLPTLFARTGRVGGAAALLLATTLASTPAQAGRVFHRYDSLGRLTRVCNALPFDSEQTNYNLDARDNRGSYSNYKLDVWIPAGSGVSSPDGRFTLWMQNDGNLVLYQNSNGQALWATNTNGTAANIAYFNSDGNLAVYGSGQGFWGSGTSNYPCARLTLQNDGNLVIYSMDDQPVWASNTGGH